MKSGDVLGDEFENEEEDVSFDGFGEVITRGRSVVGATGSVIKSSVNSTKAAANLLLNVLSAIISGYFTLCGLHCHSGKLTVRLSFPSEHDCRFQPSRGVFPSDSVARHELSTGCFQLSNRYTIVEMLRQFRGGRH